MRRIGIVGGLSPESTILYYKTIVEEYRRLRGDEKYPVIIIHSVSFGRFAEHVRRGELGAAAQMLREAIDSLSRAGADFALIAANTPHMFYDELSSASPIPLISIVDALAEQLKKDGVRRIGLLGTKTTLTKSFYKDMLARHGVEALIPEPRDIEAVNKIIYSELTKGIVKPESRLIVAEIARRLVGRGAQGVALACTELPLLFQKPLGDVKLYNTARIHALKALKQALQE